MSLGGVATILQACLEMWRMHYNSRFCGLLVQHLRNPNKNIMAPLEWEVQLSLWQHGINERPLSQAEVGHACSLVWVLFVPHAQSHRYTMLRTLHDRQPTNTRGQYRITMALHIRGFPLCPVTMIHYAEEHKWGGSGQIHSNLTSTLDHPFNRSMTAQDSRYLCGCLDS